MKNYMDSDYAVNKIAKGIVYRFADQTLEVTLEDYLRENPDKTPADFAELKAFSDDDYLETNKGNYRQTWKNTSLDTLDEDELLVFAAPSVEQEFTEQAEQAETDAKRKSIAANAWDKLTEKQQRRYFMYHVKKMTVREIAAEEGVSFQKIHQSVLAAEKKIKKVLPSS